MTALKTSSLWVAIFFTAIVAFHATTLRFDFNDNGIHAFGIGSTGDFCVFDERTWWDLACANTDDLK